MTILMSNGLKFSNIGFAYSATPFFKSHQRFSKGFKSGDGDGHCRIFQDFFCNQALVEF